MPLKTRAIKPASAILLGLCIFFFRGYAASQTPSRPVYVLVHGTWAGGWAFNKVDSLLTASGSKVYRPTLTGLGERAHLSSPDIGLSMHITDIVNVILYENLQDVILVGHSYGGMVITGVADSIPDRIRRLVYLDALVPENGERVMDLVGDAPTGKVPVVNGYLIPFWVQEGTKPPTDIPHPAKTWNDQIVLNNPARLGTPATYIWTIEKGTKPKDDEFYSQSERARQKGWPVKRLEADHNAQWSAPDDLAKMLLEIQRAKK